MTFVDYSHQSAIFNPTHFGWHVSVIGLGGIGSAVLLPLVKLGIKELSIWDDDEVVSHNIPNQMIYRPQDVGLSKVDAAVDVLRPYGALIKANPSRVNAETELQGVVIAGVDSMESRRQIWEAVHLNPMVPLYLDGRIGGEFVELYACNPSDTDEASWYEQTLFGDEEAAPLPCSARAVIHPTIILAGLMITRLTLFARDLAAPKVVQVHLPTFSFIAQ